MGLPVLQPENLEDPVFISKIEKLAPSLQVVVAFRKLPARLWKLPTHGTINLHASLLPDYRGAAPINHAIINGETTTGVTTFFIDEHIDTGKIIDQDKIEINPHETAGDLHDRLMVAGAKVLVRTVSDIHNGKVKCIDQSEISEDKAGLHKAPKIKKEYCQINWKLSTNEVYNFIRGLSPIPGAFSYLISPDNQKYYFKIFRADYEILPDAHKPGRIIFTNRGRQPLKFTTGDGVISPIEIQLAGRKKMMISEFIKGFQIDATWELDTD